MEKCCCNLISNQVIRSSNQFTQMKSFFEKNNYKSMMVRKPYYLFGCFADKWYKCRQCGRVWEFVYPEFPEQGHIKLVRVKLILNQKMIRLLLAYNPINWLILSRKSKNTYSKERFLPQDICNVVSHYYADTEWIYTNLLELNGYKPMELTCCLLGRVIFKSFLLREIKRQRGLH